MLIIQVSFIEVMFKCNMNLLVHIYTYIHTVPCEWRQNAGSMMIHYDYTFNVTKKK